MPKIALITGASSGIGLATALTVDKIGYSTIICGRREAKLLKLKKQLQNPCLHLVFDVSRKQEVLYQLQNLPEDFKEVEVLINNAGNAHGFSSVEEGNLQDFDDMIDSNIRGLLYVSKVILPGMVQRQKGHVVNISSVAGKQTYANGTVYCATKKSVEAISEGMRLDLTKHGVKVTNIAPGAVETEFSLVRFKHDEDRAKKVYEGYEPLIAEDIANAIAYAIQAPDHVTIADMTIYAKAQASPTTIYKEPNK